MTYAVTIGAGPPALMIHCSLARHEVLLPLAQLLPNRVTLFDIPGHGRSPDWDGQTDYQTLTCTLAEGLAAPASPPHANFCASGGRRDGRIGRPARSPILPTVST